jgi:hypothetical protein
VIVRYRLAIDNAGGATNVTTSSAWLNGTRYTTNDTAVQVFWGLADGGTNAAAWANTNTWSNPQTALAFTVQATGLVANASYCYRYAALRTEGLVWANESSGFITGEVWIEKTADAFETGPVAGSFTVHRAPAATNSALTVFYTVGGTAANGADYATLNGLLTLPAGAAAAALAVDVFRDYVQEATETVAVALVSGPYRIGAPAAASLDVFNYPVSQWTGAGTDELAGNPANWAGGVAPGAGSFIALDSGSSKNMTWNLNIKPSGWRQAGYLGTVTIATVYGASGFTNLVIQGDCLIDSGSWTHVANGSDETYRLRVTTEGGAFTLGAGASINVQGKGYAPGKGLGSGGASANNGLPAASHGGMGNGATKPTYGSITSPVTLGSGAYTAGGGAIWLTIGGTATIEGLISARAAQPSLAGGAGGSILIDAARLAGSASGLLDVSVPPGATGSGNKGGGGGRLAVKLHEANSFGAVRMSAAGGQTLWSQPQYGGAAGTIYLQTAGQAEGTGTLIIDNGGLTVPNPVPGLTTMTQTLMTPADANLNVFAAIIITNKGVLGMNTNTVWNLGSPANLVAYGPAQSFVATAQTTGMGIPSNWTLSGYTLRLAKNLAIAGNLTVSNATLETYAGWPVNVHVGGNLLVAKDGTISHGGNGDAEAYRLALQVGGNLTVAANGAIDVSGKGYAGGKGPGAGSAAVANWQPGSSHGGLAAEFTSSWATWVTYGSVRTPTNLGSGAYGLGGGAAEIRVAGATTLSGSIQAKGMSSGLAGNAGGSIFLTTGSLAGNGFLDASGGSTAQYGGGGGRIAAILTGSDTFGSVVMRSYGAGTRRGAVGTVYRQTATQGAGRGVLSLVGDAAAYTTNTVVWIPASAAGGTEGASLRAVTLDASSQANAALPGDLRMGDLFLRDDTVKLRLKGRTLKLGVIEHADWGTEARVIRAGGQILWLIPGSVIVIR